MKAKEKKLLCGSILLIISLSIPTTITVQAVEYNLGIEEGKSIIWEVTYVNDTLIQKLKDEGGISSTFSPRAVGQQTKYVIEEIEYKDNGTGIYHWKVDFHRYDGTNLVNSTGTEVGNGYYRNVAKDPSDAAPNWETSDSIFTNRFMPLDVSQYLTALVAAIGKTNISSSSNSLIYNNSVNGENDTSVYTYNTYGIRSNYSIYYNGSLAYSYDLVYYGDPYVDVVLMLIFIVILLGIVIIAGIAAWISKKKKSNEKYKKKQELKINTEAIRQLDQLKTGYCEVCNSELDKDAKFCPVCGLKTDKY